MTKRIECNPFVWRQTPDSRFSHFEPASGNDADRWSELAALVERYFDDEAQVRKINPEGTILGVTIPIEGANEGRFFTGLVPASEVSEWVTFYGVRDGALPGERPYIQTHSASSKKTPARYVEVIVYSKDIMPADERSYIPEDATEPVVVESEWQIVSINARLTEKAEPPTPQAMARNYAKFLGLPEGEGGTAREYTPREWMEAILFHGQHTMAAPVKK